MEREQYRKAKIRRKGAVREVRIEGRSSMPENKPVGQDYPKLVIRRRGYTLQLNTIFSFLNYRVWLLFVPSLTTILARTE
jgi:hypothetical protein